MVKHVMKYLNVVHHTTNKKTPKTKRKRDNSHIRLTAGKVLFPRYTPLPRQR